jgi:hypothetical protein
MWNKRQTFLNGHSGVFPLASCRELWSPGGGKEDLSWPAKKVMALPEGHVIFLLPLLTFPFWLVNHQYAQARDLSLSVTSLGVTGSWPVGWCTLFIPVPSLVWWNNAETLQSGRVYPSGVGIIQVKGGWRFEKFSFLFMLKNPHNIPKRRFALNSKNKDCPIFFDSAWAHCFGDDLTLRHTW